MELNEEQVMIRDTAREYARERLAPGAGERDRNATFPSDQLAEMAALGFLGMLTPASWGGGGNWDDCARLGVGRNRVW